MKRALSMNINYRQALLLVCTILAGYASFAQNLSNRGKEFWVSYPYNYYFENGSDACTTPGCKNSQEMVLYMSAEQDAVVTITAWVGNNTWVRTYNVPAGTVKASDYIPKQGTYDSRLYDYPVSFGGNGGEGHFQKGIHVKSTTPVVVYAHYIGSATSGAAMLFPVEAYGYTYTTLNNQQSYANSYTYFYVMAAHDNTVVEITPSVLTRKDRQPGVPFTVTLNKHQAYQVIANSLTGDLTGSTVRSVANADGECLPVAVYCGTSRTGLGCTGSGSSGDFIMQQCFPSQAWGKRYLTAPTSNASAANSLMTNIYRILVRDPSTKVYKNGTQMTGIINNSYYQYNSGTADYIESDKPVMVAQYMSSSGGCPNTSGNGDPEMMYISPIEQAIKRVGFFRNNREAIAQNYLTLIIPTAGVSSLRIDGTSTFSHQYAHPNLPGYTVVVRRWQITPGNDPTNPPPPGQCIVSSDSAFTAITYGLGSVESYGYNAGTLINNLSALGSLHNTYDTDSTVNSYTCPKTPMELTILMAYKPNKLVWKMSTLDTVITPGVDVVMNFPVPIDSPVINGNKYYRYKLPQSYSFSKAGTYEVPVLATHPVIENCNNTEELKFIVTVKENPFTNFTASHTGCTTDTVHFSGLLPSNGYSIEQWNWEFPAGATASGQNVSHLFAPGNHNVKLTLISAEGCVGDTVKTITIHPRPTADIKVDPAVICEGSSVTFTDTSSFAGGTAGITSWYWDFGNSNVITLTSNTPQTIAYPAYGTYTIRHVAKVSNGCVSDTATKQITVNAKPRVGFNYPAGCLPVDGVVQFTSTTTIPDAQTLTSYAWNFGDGNATPANPNTSTLANPTHIYTAYGTYNITYSVTSSAGCVKDTLVAATFNLRPTMSWPALPTVCENAGGTVSIATASVTNGVTGTGRYRGPGTDATGNFNPAIAGYGTHTVWYIFTSAGGCTDSISQTIGVYAKPKAGFTYPAGGCLPVNGLVQFTNTSSIADAQTISYLWNFGDANATPGNPNTSTVTNPSHNYAEGSYIIKLTVNSSNGCTADTTVNATFSLRPQLAYPALNNICENAATVSVATASVTNGAGGTGIYRGPGTDAAGNFNPATAGAGSHTIWYVFTTTGGCKDSISQNIIVYAKPKARFTYPAGGCLPVNGLVQFTNATTIADAQMLSYLWNFGDANATPGNPNTSTAANPAHNYAEGNYTIKLTATGSNGCVGDTTVNATFSLRPQLSYPALQSVCENANALSVATATVTNGSAGSGVYRGPGTDAAGNFNPAAAGYGTHTIWYVFTSNGGCKDSISQTILVHAKPRARFTYPSGGCLDVNGLVQFTNTSTIADAQTLSYLWNFGDANATPGNPNTSTQKDPTHNYNDGNYTIKLSVNSSNGCAGDTTITASFSRRPLLAYPSLAAVCQSVQGAVSVASATVTNGANGTGIYKGPGTDVNGNFSPSTAGAGTHTIWYVFTSNGGCKDSISQSIRVHAKPKASFTHNGTGCLPVTGLVQFSNGTTISDAQTLSYLWNFGDANATPGNPNTSTQLNPTHNYLEGNFSIKLSVTTSNGCTADTTIAATLSVKPQLSYPALSSICQSVTTPVSVATATVTNGITGTGVYRGPGVNAAGSFNASAAGYGTHTIWYVFTTAGGCKDSIAQTIKVHPKPIGNFNITADVCVNQSALVIDNSTIPAGRIVNWQWDFGNLTNASNNNGNPFSISYSNYNTYQVRLIAVSDSGCVSDPVTKPVSVHPLPLADFNLPTAICMPDGNATFTNKTTLAENSPLIYSWDFGDASGASNATNPTHVYANKGPFSVKLTATSSYGCRHDTVKVLNAFFDKPTALFEVAPDTLCQGTDNVFTDRSYDANSTISKWAWNFGDGGSSTSKNPVKKYAKSGNYDVQLVVTNTAGCASDAFSKKVIVYLQPVIDAGPSFVVPQGTMVQFKATANDSANLRFTWTPSIGLSNGNALRPAIVVMSDQIYTLTAIGEGNCMATDVLTVKVLKPVKVPNAFSPNGDNQNDVWRLDNLADYPGATVEVFNRYGQVVYRAGGSSQPWDGKYKGTPLPVATYYYIIDLKNGFAPLTGSVTIIR